MGGNPLHCTLHCTALHCTSLHCTALRCAVLYALLHCQTLGSSTLLHTIYYQTLRIPVVLRPPSVRPSGRSSARIICEDDLPPAHVAQAGLELGTALGQSGAAERRSRSSTVIFVFSFVYLISLALQTLRIPVVLLRPTSFSFRQNRH